jgi:hypothetical protein
VISNDEGSINRGGKPQSVFVGDVFPNKLGSKAKVVSYSSNKDVEIIFLDKFKYSMITYARSLKLGSFKNPYHPTVNGVGYIGVGRFTVFDEEGKMTPEYRAWKGMLSRCYTEKVQQKQPCYKGCYVCDEWLCYNTFADWYTSQKYYGLNYQLDKDILVEGNKEYSPDYARLVPKELNVLLTSRESKRGEFPVGVVKPKKSKSYLAQLNANSKKVGLGSFKTASEASAAYVNAKERHVKNKALEYANRVDWEIFVSLMNWEVYSKEAI